MLLTAPLRSGIHQAPYHFYGGYSPFWYRYFFPITNLNILSIVANGGFFKHYGESTQRFVSILFPKSGQKKHRRVYLFPVFIVLKLSALFICVICFFFDRLDKEKEFTVGYHVKAIKEKNAEDLKKS